MLSIRKLTPLASALALAAVLGACDDDVTFRDRPFAVDDSTRVFNQVERLGNPLVSEVTLMKRDHGFHNDGTPSTDRANFQAKTESFIINVAGRTQAHATAVAQVLLPDMLVIQTDKAPATVGWLSYVLDPQAYGGRKLNDDVVDIGLLAIFCDLVTNDGAAAANRAAGLCSDNVAAFGGGPTHSSQTFPYLAAPNNP